MNKVYVYMKLQARYFVMNLLTIICVVNKSYINRHVNIS